jgi:DNA-binding response OmpR family regulator
VTVLHCSKRSEYSRLFILVPWLDLLARLERCFVMTKVSACQNNNPFVGRSILIVQKQWTIARRLVLAFETKGAQVLSVRGAAAAWELADDPDLAAAVLDGDSAQLCRLLDENHVPYVVHSGSEQLDDECAGATVIPKPASAEEVVASVERLLGPRQVIERYAQQARSS